MKTSAPVLREEEHDILFGVINRFIGYYSREAQRETKNDTSSEYPFVAMDTRQVFRNLNSSMRKQRGNRGRITACQARIHPE